MGRDPDVRGAPHHQLRVRLVKLTDLTLYEGNARRGDVAALAESLDRNGQYKPIVVNAGALTGRPNEVLAGNHTVLAARQLGWHRVAVVTVDVDDDTARRIALADNRTADLGDYDDRLLLEELAKLPDLDGSGYTPADIAALEADLARRDDAPPDDDAPPGEGSGAAKAGTVQCPECGHCFDPKDTTT